MSGDRPGLVYRVAKRIAARRTELGLTQEVVAARLNIAWKNFQRIESGKQNLSLKTIERICVALEVEPEVVLAGPLPGAGEGSSELPSALARLSQAGFVVRAATEPGRRPHNAVPVTTLRAAAGQLAGTARAIETIGWVTLPRESAAPEGQFVAEIRGTSMEPTVRSGAICLFGRPGPAPYIGRTVLVTHGSFQDDDLGGPYALKRIKAAHELPDGTRRIELESLNPAFASIEVDANELRVIAELVEVLVPGPGVTASAPA